MLNKILKEIEKADIITIFRHQFPDMDAFGSQFGLGTWIKEAYPEKKVYCLGQMSKVAKNIIDQMDEASDEVVASSLSIVLDCANAARIDDERYKLAKKSIRIDHHVQVETICDLEWIDEKATAVCEMLPLFFQYHNIKISSTSAQYLYYGLIADNIRFSISNVREKTFDAAKYLLSCGVDVVKADQVNFSTSLIDYQYETKVRSKAIVKEHAMTSIMEIEDYTSCHQNFSMAKEKVYALSGVNEITVWALFTRMEDGIHYSASLRSRTLDIRSIAQMYNGGGHKCASGIKNLTREQVDEIIDLLSKKSLESN